MLGAIVAVAMFTVLVSFSAEMRGSLATIIARKPTAEELDVSQITASKTCNGVTYTYTANQGVNESAADFRARAQAEIEAWLDTLPC